MRRVAQAPPHHEVELRQPDPVQAAQAHVERPRPKQARVVAVEHGGWRRVVDAVER